ncbi:MAG TPA: hypothetical protein PLD18_12275 [Flavobacterium sp.]|nr:hypothetical protein [Flavobacterium sp.]HRA72510.1 hypothetical protein [Flavobacterium sp.]
MKIKLKHIAFILLLIVFAPIYPVLLRSCFYPLKVDPELIKKYNSQKNPFSVQNDSAEIVWKRASQFLELRKSEMTGGNLQQNDSVIFMPYYTDYHKGRSLKIERKQVGDSTIFTVNFWYSEKPVENRAKEIALYMATSFDRRNIKKHEK